MTFIVFTPFLMSLLAPVVCRATPRKSGWALALLPLSLFAFLLYLAPEVANGHTLQSGFHWLPALQLEMTFLLDGLSLLFALLITGIGALIVVYAQGYFGDDRRLGRLYGLLFFFMGSMLGVVLSDNLFALFTFWELTGIASYFLIGFDNEKSEARAAAWQALMVTTAGGLALMAGVVFLGIAAESFSLRDILQGSLAEHRHYPVILGLVLFAAFTKSAQFPFHFWLPNAMAAPTPISAYLHSATMVKAGIYLLARLSPTLGGTDLWFYAVAGGGGLTIAVSSALAIRATVLKRQLAYTTVCGLGLIVMCIGIGTPAAIEAAMLFLCVHACYKAALFMAAGAIMDVAHESHTEKLGGLFRALPMTALGAGAAALSMAGIPPLLGFIGKESIYGSALRHESGLFLLLGVALLGNAVNLFVALTTGFRPFWAKPPADVPKKRVESVALALGPVMLGAAGIGFGLFPGVLAHYGVAPAAMAVLQEDHVVALSLWHGFNLPLLLSAITMVAGITLYALRARVRRLLDRLAWYPGGFSRLYDRGVQLVLAFATGSTALIQNGKLRSYVLMTVLFMIALPGSALFFSRLPLLPKSMPTLAVSEALLIFLINIAALNVIRVRSRLHAVASLSVVGYGVALVFVLYGAPDLAMTQFVTETLTLLIFVLVLHRLPAFKRYSSAVVIARDVVISVFAGALMCGIILASLKLEIAPRISEYFIENSYIMAHGRNMVNVILVDFRAIDTLGEITVLVVAALGAYGLLSQRIRRPRSSAEKGS